MKDIYTYTPLNKTAAITTSQKGCTSHNGLNRNQKRDNLVAKLKSLTKYHNNTPNKHPRKKRLGKQIYELQLQIAEIRPKKKFHRDFANYIVEVLKKRYSKQQWITIINEAEKNLQNDKNKNS